MLSFNFKFKEARNYSRALNYSQILQNTYFLCKDISVKNTNHRRTTNYIIKIHGLVQERRNSSVLAMELSLSCYNPSNMDMVNILSLSIDNKLFLCKVQSYSSVQSFPISWYAEEHVDESVG